MVLAGRSIASVALYVRMLSIVAMGPLLFLIQNITITVYVLQEQKCNEERYRINTFKNTKDVNRGRAYLFQSHPYWFHSIIVQLPSNKERFMADSF